MESEGLLLGGGMDIYQLNLSFKNSRKKILTLYILVYGVLFSLRNIIQKITPPPPNSPPGTTTTTNFLTFTTSQYRCSYFQVPTLKLVLFCNTELNETELLLRRIFEIYVEYVSKNPLIPFDSPLIDNELFRTNLLRYIRAL